MRRNPFRGYSDGGDVGQTDPGDASIGISVNDSGVAVDASGEMSAMEGVPGLTAPPSLDPGTGMYTDLSGNIMGYNVTNPAPELGTLAFDAAVMASMQNTAMSPGIASAMMGLAGLVAPPVGLVGSLASIANAMQGVPAPGLVGQAIGSTGLAGSVPGPNISQDVAAGTAQAVQSLGPGDMGVGEIFGPLAGTPAQTPAPQEPETEATPGVSDYTRMYNPYLGPLEYYGLGPAHTFFTPVNTYV